MSYLLRGLAADGNIRVVAADTTSITEEARQRHSASATASAALGRSLTAALLLSHVLLKDHRDRVTLKLDGGGVLGGLITEAGLDGTVRGYVKYPDRDVPLRPDGKLNVGAAIGSKGLIEVIRSHAPYGDPFSSSVELVSGEVAEDVAMFLAQSEQINSATLLGVYIDNGTVTQSGGILLQALPNANEAALQLLEANIRSFGSLTDAMAHRSMLENLEELCWGLNFELLTPDALPLKLECRCSEAKALDAIAYFSPEEREQMIAEEGGAEVVCHWCNEKRWLNAEQIRSISSNERRCPDCGTLWYREGQATMIRENETCACGRPVLLPA